MSVGIYNFSIVQGSPFALIFDCTDGVTGLPIDFTGSTAAMQLREHYTSPLAADFTPYLTLNGPEGRITLSVPAHVTATIPIGRGVYDLKLTPASGPDHALRVIQGEWDLSPEVTK